MTALESQLQKHLQKLPPDRIAEVVDFAAFLAAREERQAAVQRLREDMARMDARGLPPLTEDEIAQAVEDARRKRRRQAADDDAGDTTGTTHRRP